MNDTIIRRLGERNYEQIVEYLKRTDRIYPVPMSQRVNIETHAAKVLSKGVVIAAIHKGEIVGILLGYANDMENRRAYLGTLGIAPGFRSMGIGAVMVQEFEHYAEENEMQTVALHAHRDNYRAIKFYEKNGYTLTFDENKPYEESVYLTKTVALK